MKTDLEKRLQFREKLKLLCDEYMQNTHEPDIFDFYGDIIQETSRAMFLGMDEPHRDLCMSMITSMAFKGIEEILLQEI